MELHRILFLLPGFDPQPKCLFEATATSEPTFNAERKLDYKLQMASANPMAGMISSLVLWPSADLFGVFPAIANRYARRLQAKLFSPDPKRKRFCVLVQTSLCAIGPGA